MDIEKKIQELEKRIKELEGFRIDYNVIKESEKEIEERKKIVKNKG